LKIVKVDKKDKSKNKNICEGMSRSYGIQITDFLNSNPKKPRDIIFVLCSDNIPTDEVSPL